MKILLYTTSLIFSYLIINGFVISFEWWMLLAIPFFALWLTAPIFFGDYKKGDSLFYVVLGYGIWVAIQWLIYYFGLGPPEGIGIPYF